MAKISYADKVTGGQFSAADANEIKTVVNGLDDAVAARPTTEQMNAAIAAAVNDLADGAPGALDTLNELAAAMNDDANFAATVTAALANKQNKALIAQDYAGELNLSTGGEVSYKISAINTAHTPTVTALAENSVARVVLDAGASASLVDTNLGTKRPESDDFTISKKNELTVMVLPDGTDGALVKYYSIKVLN